MGAVLRGECQRWALDMKQTCFGVSFDGKAAFPANLGASMPEFTTCERTIFMDK